MHRSFCEGSTVACDCYIHYDQVSGKASAKVFRLKALDLAPGEQARSGKTISIADMTTRKHSAGKHRVDVLLKGIRLSITNA